MRRQSWNLLHKQKFQPGFANALFVAYSSLLFQVSKFIINPPSYTTVVESCEDLYHGGFRQNGMYKVRSQANRPLSVFCDFESEVNSVWTLVTSYALQNVSSFRIPYFTSNPIKEDTPNWISYRYAFNSSKLLVGSVMNICHEVL